MGKFITLRSVYKVRLANDGDEPHRYYAMKKLRVTKESNGIPTTAMREITTLNKVRHPNLSHLHEILISKCKIHLS